MEGYVFLKQLGKGAEGTVWKAVQKGTGRICAIKRMNGSFSKYKNCWKLAEVECLQKLHPHENIVALHDVILEGTTLYLVLEYMECDLSKLFRVHSFSEHEIRNICFQILRGLVHMHSKGYCHRDLKPQNLLVNGNIIKIGDFGLAVKIQHENLESYIGTRLYRAPEVLLGSTDYDFSIDIWALGVITAELFTGYPLFVGSNTQNLIGDICSVIGCPDNRTWHQGLALTASMDYRFPEECMKVDSSKELCSSLPGASAVAIDFINSLLSWDPK